MVGDVNDRGVMVGNDGTVRLIDCDSFQVTSGQKTFLCEVGVPEYTPPELQGQSLSGVTRLPAHDAFGLAVVIFRLLFMGRHPFAGIYQGGHKEIQDAIKECRYAYANDVSRTRMQPPPNMVTVSEGGGASVASLFEQAFSPDTVRQPGSQAGAGRVRPSAAEWVSALQALKENLTTCRFNAAHAYVRSLSACPWCELEQRSNVDLFHFVTTGSQPAIDVDAIWTALGNLKAPVIPRPPPESLFPVEGSPMPQSLASSASEANKLGEESERARKVASDLAATAVRQISDFDNLLIEETSGNAEVIHLAHRIAALRAPERSYLLSFVLVAIGGAVLVCALRFQNAALLLLGASAMAAKMLADTVAARARKWATKRVEARLSALRRAVICANPELNARFNEARSAAHVAEEEATRAENVAEGLQRAASEAQARYERELAAERATRDGRLAAAKSKADDAISVISRLEGESVAVQKAISERRSRLALSRANLDRLARTRDAEYTTLRDQDRAAQLHRFLDNQYIDKANIRGITRSLKSALASFSIETAADINRAAVSNVPGFGDVRTKKMMDWRNEVTKRFRYTPSNQIDPAQKRAIEDKYQSGRARIARDFTVAQGELTRRISDLSARIGPVKQAADQSIRLLAQARADRKVLP